MENFRIWRTLNSHYGSYRDPEFLLPVEQLPQFTEDISLNPKAQPEGSDYNFRGN